MGLDSLLATLSVEALGLEKYGFIEGIDDYEIKTTTYFSNLSLCDSPAETKNESSNTNEQGDELLSDACEAQGKIMNEKSAFLDNPSSNNSFVAHVCKATNPDTSQKSYPHLGLFNRGKNIWCNCVDSQSSWGEDAYDLAKNWESLANYYPPCETDDYLSNDSKSFFGNCTSITQEEKGYDYRSSYDQLYGPASPKRNMPLYNTKTMLNNAYGTFDDEASCSHTPSSLSNSANNLYENSSIYGDYDYLFYNKFKPNMSDMLAMSSDNIMYLITDQIGCSSFKELIPFCTQLQLKLIVDKLSVNNKNLINAACTEIGSRSLQVLIKKLKKMKLAMPMTQALSSGCYVMMIDQFGRRVIQQCFDYLDCNENKPLYEEVIHRCLDLSIDKAGCLSLNASIDTFKGSYQNMLLDVISDHTLYLSFSPYGTFVIQHILKLCNPKYSDKICELLVGNYASLSQVYRGSHLVEKCLKHSNLGLFYLIDEIKTIPGMLENLAKHEFGNYVIQQALIISKETNLVYYGYLIQNLLPLLRILEKIKYGKKLANLLRDLIQESY